MHEVREFAGHSDIRTTELSTFAAGRLEFELGGGILSGV
jgi:hypothetical protein